MIVKKFQAGTEAEAILKARDELGSKAVVLSVKTIKQRGFMKLFKKDAVEITAALEEDDFIDGIEKNKPVMNSSNASERQMLGKAFMSKGSAQSGKTQGTSVGGLNLVADETIVVNPGTVAIEQKLDSLHSLLQSQLASANAGLNDTSSRKNTLEQFNADDETAATAEESMGEKVAGKRESTNVKFLKLIYNKLVDNEVDEKYADMIIKEIEGSLKKESNIDSILSAVYQKIILKLGTPVSIDLGEKSKVVFFIGPTGVGKTTTIAKVASKYKLDHYAKVAFITSDTYRIAAVEQLNTYASIMDCPISVVYSVDELEGALDEYKDYDLIIVDTAGRSHKCEDQMDELKSLLGKMDELKEDYDLEIYLTLSMTTKYKDLVNITERYSDIDDWAIIFTKLDETCSLGNILNIRMLTGAPLSYTTSGQNVPDDIEIINEQALAKQLLGGGA